MSTPRPDRYRRDGGLFCGWYIVGALFFATFIGVDARQGFGVFAKTWEEDFGTSVGMVSAAAAVGWLVNGISQPVFGRLTDRFGGRRALTSSLLAMGVLPGLIVVVLGRAGGCLSSWPDGSGGAAATGDGAVMGPRACAPAAAVL